MKTSEVFLAKTNSLKDGEHRIFSAEGTDILLIRSGDRYYATGAYCTHYGAPLDQGVLHADRIYCPWHHACFSAKNGDLKEPPALDALEHYEVKVEGEDVYVVLPEEVAGSRTPQMATYDPDKDDRTFVILGAGAAGNAAAQALREDGFAGKIIMVTKENRVPYDRPNLSKEYLQGEAEPDWMPLRPDEFYEQHHIELRFNTTAESVMPSAHSITFTGGEKLRYDALLLATGSTPRKLSVPGSTLQNIFTLRSFDDADRIIEALEGKSNAVIVGSSFIGMETAHSLRHRGLEVTVVSPDNLPFGQIFGEEIGKMFRSLHKENGVTFRLEQSVSGFTGDNAVSGVQLDDGEVLPADLVIVGIGVRPATAYLKEVTFEKDGSVRVDHNFQVTEEVYAAGDIATYEEWNCGEMTRIEHWRHAEQQGRAAAHSMMGLKQPYQHIPFFWTSQAGIEFRYVGHAHAWDSILVDGDIEKKEFVIYYIKNGTIRAAAGVERDRQMDAIEELMRLKKMPSLEALKAISFDIVKILEGISE